VGRIFQHYDAAVRFPVLLLWSWAEFDIDCTRLEGIRRLRFSIDIGRALSVEELQGLLRISYIDQSFRTGQPAVHKLRLFPSVLTVETLYFSVTSETYDEVRISCQYDAFLSFYVLFSLLVMTLK
jgi:hypothetical protein